jgi:hypothetical protein
MDNAENNIDYNELFKLLKNTCGEPPLGKAEKSPYIEKAILSQELRIMKSIIPYLDYAHQKTFSLLVKLIEFKKTIELYDDMDNYLPGKLEKKAYNLIDILTDVKNSCDEENQRKLNLFLNILKMQNLNENFYTKKPQLTNENQPTSTSTSDNYDGFMNLLNKVINEKE